MHDEILARLDQLSTAFARLANRAPWVRAGFTVKAGRFGFFGLGRPDGDGPDAAPLRGVRSDQELAIISELYALTDRAGALAAEICQSGHYQGKAVSPKSVHYDLREPRGFWLVLLLHTPPLCFQCRVKDPDGRKRLAFSQLGESEAAVWIDSYPQVCVSALAWLQAGSPAVGAPPAPSAAGPGTMRAPSTPAQAPAAPSADEKENGPHPDGPEGGRWVWWKNERRDVPQGTIYRLLAYMWNHDSASYDDLLDAEVFDTVVQPQTVRSYANKANNALPTGFPWRLSADSISRQLTKVPAAKGA